MTDLTGKVLKNRYRVDAYLGRGGMAEVYRAFDTKRNYNVAIKVMHPDLAEDREFVNRFRQEAESLAALAHDNIVRFYSLEKDHRLIFLVMDYVEGITLRTLISEADAPLPLGQVAHTFPQMCQALHYAHEEGFVHRDVKPGNIMLRPDGRVLVSDFGIAKATDAATITTYMPGTPAYMSPEQCRSQMVDRRSDVYALGIVLFEMVTGRRPFLGQTESTTGSTREKIRWEQMNAQPPSPREFNPDIPAALERVILKAMAKTPEERFSTALGMLETFEIAGGDIPKEIPPVSGEPSLFGVETMSLPVKTVSETPSPTFQEERKPALSPVVVAALVVVVLAAMLFGGWMFFRESPTPTLEAPPAIVEATATDLPATDAPTPTKAVAMMSGKLSDDTSVHAGPGTEYASLGTLDKDTMLAVNARNQKGTWWQIFYTSGEDGLAWIDVDYAEITDGNNPDDLPIVVAEKPTQPPPSDTPRPTQPSTPTKTPTDTPTPTDEPEPEPPPPAEKPAPPPTPTEPQNRISVEQAPNYPGFVGSLAGKPVLGASFSHDGKFIAASDGTKLYVLGSQGGYPEPWMHENNGFYPGETIVWSPNREYIAFTVNCVNCNQWNRIVGVVAFSEWNPPAVPTSPDVWLRLEVPGHAVDEPRWATDGRLLVTIHSGDLTQGKPYIYNGKSLDPAGSDYTLSSSFQGQRWYPWKNE